MELTLNNQETTNSQARAAADAETMRAVLQTGYGSTDVLRIGTTARPSPGEGEVLVRVRSAAIDRGTWHLMTGRPYLMRIMGFGFSAPKNPVPGIDLSGTVVAVGPNVTRFRVGDEVFGIGKGTFAELAVAREDKLALAPKGVPLDEAAALGVSALTALQALTDVGKLQAGERVLIVGASGGVGSFAVQIAKALAAHVTAVSSGEKAAFVAALGADELIDYKTRDFCDGPMKHDLVLDIGGNTPLSRLRRAMTPTGRLVFVGGENGGDITAGFGRQIWALLLSPFVKQRFAMMMAAERGADLERVAALCDAGKIRPAIDRVCALADVPQALADMESGRLRGKTIVKIG